MCVLCTIVCTFKAKERRNSRCNALFVGAEDGTRTHTSWTHAPQTCLSADSSTSAYRLTARGILAQEAPKSQVPRSIYFTNSAFPGQSSGRGPPRPSGSAEKVSQHAPKSMAAVFIAPQRAAAAIHAGACPLRLCRDILRCRYASDRAPTQ